MSSKKTPIRFKADDPRKVEAEFEEHMRHEYFNNHVFRGSTVLLLNNGRTLAIKVPARRDW